MTRLRRTLALVAGGVGAAMIVSSAAFIGLGILNSHQLMAAAQVPLQTTTIEPAPTNEPSTGPAEAAVAVVSNLPAEMIEGLPDYTASHDRETYIRVQMAIKLCMRDREGFSYEFELAPDSGDVTGLVSTGFIPMPDGFDQQEQRSLYGEPGNLLPSYDWTKGGCYGQAIHKAGLVDPATAGFTDTELQQIDGEYSEMVNPPEPVYGYAGKTPGTGATVERSLFETIDSSITACMAEHDIVYSVEQNIQADGTASLDGGVMTVGPASGEQTGQEFYDNAMITLFGPRSAASEGYHWQNSGCYGQAVHDAGISGAE